MALRLTLSGDLPLSDSSRLLVGYEYLSQARPGLGIPGLSPAISSKISALNGWPTNHSNARVSPCAPLPQEPGYPALFQRERPVFDDTRDSISVGDFRHTRHSASESERRDLSQHHRHASPVSLTFTLSEITAS